MLCMSICHVFQALRHSAQLLGRARDLSSFLDGIDCSEHLGALEAQQFTLDTLIKDSDPSCVDPLMSEALRSATEIPTGACRRILAAARKLGARPR